MKNCRAVLCGALLTVAFATQVAAVELGPLLEKLQAVGPEGAGNPEASRAWQQVVEVDAARLPELLAAMDEAGPLADNWIRTAVDAVAERQLNGGGPLPAEALERFARDTSHDPRGRRVAFEWLVEVDPTAHRRLLIDMVDDPSLQLRRDAIAQLIGDAAQVAELSSPEESLPLYRRAFSAARDPDQIKLLADRLGKLGEVIDVTRHYGFILRWKLIGPFDNSGGVGFDAPYPPEQQVDFDAPCEGKHGPVRWSDHASTHEQGVVDLNKALGEEKGVVAYAASQFLSGKRQEVEIRISSSSAVKLWLGGKFLAGHEVYHSGSPMDQYTSRALLEPGSNLILVKVCQNEQTQSWARVWGFKLRVCDPLGGAVLSADRDEKKGTGPIRAQHPPGRSGELDLSPFSAREGDRT